MRRLFRNRTASDCFLFILILGSALAVSFALASVDNDNNPFAMAVFILAVALIGNRQIIRVYN